MAIQNSKYSLFSSADQWSENYANHMQINLDDVINRIKFNDVFYIFLTTTVNDKILHFVIHMNSPTQI